MKKKCALLFKTHVWPFGEGAFCKGFDILGGCKRYAKAVANYNTREDREFDYDLWVLYDATGDGDFQCSSADYNTHSVRMRDINEHGFTHNRSSSFNPLASKNRYFKKSSPMWYNGEHPLLDFYIRTSSDYSYYWMLEYDVDADGNFCQYLISYDNVSEDFLSYYPKLKKPGCGWCWWDSMSGFDYKQQAGSYFPVTRFSNKACSELVDLYKNGAHGFCEVLTPTALLSAGLSLGDLHSFSTPYRGKCIIKHDRKRLGPWVPPLRKKGNEEKEEKEMAE